MMDHIQRAVGILIGAAVTLVLIILTTDWDFYQAIAPLTIGGLVAWAWPAVVAFWQARQEKKGKAGDQG